MGSLHTSLGLELVSIVAGWVARAPPLSGDETPVTVTCGQSPWGWAGQKRLETPTGQVSSPRTLGEGTSYQARQGQPGGGSL